MNRYDIYAPIHKALRNFMGDTLAAVGRLDVEDDTEVAETLDQVRGLLATLRMHLDAENRFVHLAMHDRDPGSADKTAVDHEGHEHAIERLESLAGEAQFRAGGLRGMAVAALYRELAVFVAENLEHMNYEETKNNEALWRTHSDEELRGIERAIVADLTPEKKMTVFRWMIPALPPAGRADLLAKLRQSAPAPVIDAVLQIAKRNLSDRDWAKLSGALGFMPKAA